MSLFCYASPLPEPLTIESQRAAIQQYCERAGLTPNESFEDAGDDAWRAHLRDRVAGRDLLGRLAPGDEVIVASPVVLSATLRGYARLTTALAEVGVTVRIASLSGDAAPAKGGKVPGLGRLGRVLAGEAKKPSLGSLSKSEQVRIGLAFARAAGKRTGRHAPIGFKWVRRRGAYFLAPDENERKVVAAIVKLRERGLSWSQVASALLHHKVRTSSGLAWDTRRIRRAHALAAAGELPLDLAATGSTTGTSTGA